MALQTITADQKRGISVLFSNDLSLSAQTMIDYHSLRFQIEFDFRDGKQFFGLSDFKNYQRQNVENFTHMIFAVTLLSKQYLCDIKLSTWSNLTATNDLRRRRYISVALGISPSSSLRCQALNIRVKT